MPTPLLIRSPTINQSTTIYNYTRKQKPRQIQIRNELMPIAKTYIMARRSSNYRFLTTDPIPPSHSSINNTPEFEFDELDVWDGSTQSVSPDSRPPQSTRQSRRPLTAPTPARREAASSLPVNIPDWSNILRGEYKAADKWSLIEGGDNGDEWVPPHEYLAKTQMASFSVHEGIGRTLKGRDLRKVRNAIWEKTGFED